MARHKQLTGTGWWATVQGTITRTNARELTWRFRLGAWTCASDNRDATCRYRWVVQGDTVRCTQVYRAESWRRRNKYQFEVQPKQLSELMTAIILNPNSIIPDFPEAEADDEAQRSK